MILVLVEHQGGAPDDLSLQALAFARGLGAPVHAVLYGAGARDVAPGLGAHGVATAHVADGDGFDAYAPMAWAQGLVQLAAGADAVVGPGTDRGMEVLAHVAARLDLPFSASCVAAALGSPTTVTRVRWGGTLHEQALLHGAPALLTVAPHAVPAAETGGGPAAVEALAPTLAPGDLAVRVAETVPVAADKVTLAEAKVVVSGGRGTGGTGGWGPIEELAGLLNGAVGCSRAVTAAGWRPHADQVGQTGTKIAPELYIACGISGATQHMAGCRGSKRILAINTDPEAPILAHADYAVIGDLHDVVPAIVAEVRRALG